MIICHKNLEENIYISLNHFLLNSNQHVEIIKIESIYRAQCAPVTHETRRGRSTHTHGPASRTHSCTRTTVPAALLWAVTAADTLEGVKHTKVNNNIGQICLKCPRFIKRVRRVQRRTRSIKIALVNGARAPSSTRGGLTHQRAPRAQRSLRHHVWFHPVFREVIPERTGRGGQTGGQGAVSASRWGLPAQRVVACSGTLTTGSSLWRALPTPEQPTPVGQRASVSSG